VDACFNGVCKNTPIPSTLSITVTQLPQFCQGNTVTLTAVAPSAISFAWSTGATTPSITATAGTAYTVTATFAAGCTRTATSTTSPQSLLSAYVIIADKEVNLRKNTVNSGGVGARNTGGKINLTNGSLITAAGTFAIANTITLNGGSAATVQITAPAPVALPPFQFNPFCNGQNLNISNNTSVTITGSNYKDVNIGKNCIVTFTQMNLNMKSLDVKEGSELRFADCTKLRICKSMKLDKNTRFNTAGKEVIVYVEDHVDIDKGVRVNADIYVLNGNIKIQKADAVNPNIMTGLFIAKTVEADDFTYWNMNTACNSLCAGSPAVASKLSGENEEGNEPQHASPDETLSGKDVELKAYPNPFTDRLNIEFALPEDSRVRLEIFNLAGQRVAELFEGDVKAGELQKYEFTPDKLSDGIIIYRLQTDLGVFFGKAVLTK